MPDSIFCNSIKWLIGVFSFEEWVMYLQNRVADFKYFQPLVKVKVKAFNVI